MRKYKDPEIVKALLSRSAQNTWLMDFDNFIAKFKLREVTEILSFEPNSRSFHPNGLYSEDIFGSITSEERFSTLAYINLNTTVIHPVIYKEVIAKKRLYVGILSGKIYGLWDKEINDFVKTSANEEGAQTGFHFFTSHIKDLAKKKINMKSLTARNNQELLKKNIDMLMCSKVLVLPAGLRDMDISKGEVIKDEVNSIYTSLISYSMAFRDNTNTKDKMFDDPRWRLQQKYNEIYEYIVIDIAKGKRGFIEGHYITRKVAMSTRNVLTVNVPEGNMPDTSKTLKTDETLVGFINVIKAFQPFANKFIRKDVFAKINDGTNIVPAINPETFELGYIDMDVKTLFKYQDKKRIDVIINKLEYPKFRDSPVSVKDQNGVEHYLVLKYETKDKVYLGESISDLRNVNPDIKKSDIQPVTWGEIMYIGALTFTKGKHVFVTRYPANGDGSIFPSKVKIGTTNPNNQKEIYQNQALTLIAPMWPVLGHDYFGAVAVSVDKLRGLNGDYDGDVVSVTGVWTDEGNASIQEYLSAPRSVITSDNKLRYGSPIDTVDKILINLTSDVPA